MKRVIRMDQRDNVAVVIEDVEAGQEIRGPDGPVRASRHIPRGHKVALTPIRPGDMVVKYGITIGQASREILPGDHVHVHNVRDITERLCAEYARQFRLRGGQDQ